MEIVFAEGILFARVKSYSVDTGYGFLYLPGMPDVFLHADKQVGFKHAEGTYQLGTERLKNCSPERGEEVGYILCPGSGRAARWGLTKLIDCHQPSTPPLPAELLVKPPRSSRRWSGGFRSARFG